MINLLAPVGVVSLTVAVGLQYGAVGLAVWGVLLLLADWIGETL